MALGPVLRRRDQEHRTATTLELSPVLLTAALVLLVSGLFASIPVTIAATAIVMAGLVAMLVARDGAPGVGENAILD